MAGAAPKVAEAACSLPCNLAWYLESTQQNKQEGPEPCSLYRYRSRRPRCTRLRL